MTRTIQFLLTLGIVAIIVWALRFVPQLGVPPGVTGFCGGFGAAFLIAALVNWAGARGRTQR